MTRITALPFLLALAACSQAPQMTPTVTPGREIRSGTFTGEFYDTASGRAVTLPATRGTMNWDPISEPMGFFNAGRTSTMAESQNNTVASLSPCGPGKYGCDFAIFDENGKMVVQIDMRDGRVTLGDPKHASKAAHAFWRAVTATFGEVCPKVATSGKK